MNFSKGVAIALIVALVVLLGGGATFFILSDASLNNGGKGDPNVVQEPIDLKATNYLPENAYSVEAANTTAKNFDEWWKYYSNMVPYDVGLPEDLDIAENVESIAFAQFVPDAPDVDSNPWITSMLVVYPKEGKLLEVADAIQLGDEYSGQVTFALDEKAFAITDDAGVYTAEATLQGEQPRYEVTDETAAFANDNDSFKEFDVQQWINTLVSYKPQYEASFTALIEESLGVEPDTTFLMASTDAGHTWTGSAVSGGFDIAQAAPGRAIHNLYETNNNAELGTTFTFSQAQMTLSAKKVGGDNEYGAVLDPSSKEGKTRTANPAENDSMVQFVYSPSMLQSGFPGEIFPTNTRYVLLDLYEDNKVQMATDFYAPGEA